jgi:tRNA uridine 5-carboxymethylaminomethyl modification enzyme
MQRLTSERFNGKPLLTHLSQPGMRYTSLPGAYATLPGEVIEQIEIQARYHGYLEQEEREVARARSAEALMIPTWLDYCALPSLRYEAREKLSHTRPTNLGQAARIPGITPADIALLMIAIKRGQTP